MSGTLVIAVADVATELCLGVPQAERAKPQTVLISIRLTRPAAQRFASSSRIGATIDYDRLIGFIRETLPAQGPFLLVEAVADAVAEHALTLGGRSAEVEVTVKKPAVLAPPAMASVTLVRRSES
jgi:FolB domain-containing protein